MMKISTSFVVTSFLTYVNAWSPNHPKPPTNIPQKTKQKAISDGEWSKTRRDFLSSSIVIPSLLLVDGSPGTIASAVEYAKEVPTEKAATSAGRKQCKTTTTPSNTVVTCTGDILQPIVRTTSDDEELGGEGAASLIDAKYRD